jgi:hypothetical protein
MPTKLCRRTLQAASRREFLEKAGLGFGALAAEFLLQRDAVAASTNPFAAKPPHFAARAKHVIFLFMHGGPSHVDTFDPKPLLAKLDGPTVPPSFGKVDFQFTRMDRAPLMASRRTFKKRAGSGLDLRSVRTHHAACRRPRRDPLLPP